MNTIPQTHEQFYRLIDNDQKLIQFLIDNKVCDKRSKCQNPKYQSPKLQKSQTPKSKIKTTNQVSDLDFVMFVL